MIRLAKFYAADHNRQVAALASAMAMRSKVCFLTETGEKLYDIVINSIEVESGCGRKFILTTQCGLKLFAEYSA